MIYVRLKHFFIEKNKNGMAIAYDILLFIYKAFSFNNYEIKRVLVINLTPLHY